MERTARELRLGGRVREGFTLLELVFVLALLGVLTGAASPHISAVLDRMAVRGAREDAAGLLGQARGLALTEGEAEVTIREVPCEIVVRTPGGSYLRSDLASRYGVKLEIPGAARSATLRFDALGLGRMASRTLRFRKGSAEAALTISVYGRVRRR